MRRTDFAKPWCWRVDAGGALFCVGISLLGYFAAVRPLMQQSTDLTAQQHEVATQRQRVSQLAASDFAHRKRLELVRGALSEHEVKLRSTDHVNRQIAELTELTGECGLEVEDIQVGEVLRGGRYDIVPITLSGSGGYDKSAVFLHKLSGSFPDTGVESFEVSGSPAEPKATGKFRFGLFWYASSSAKHFRE